jgi:hypothetical protein
MALQQKPYQKALTPYHDESTRVLAERPYSTWQILADFHGPLGNKPRTDG